MNVDFVNLGFSGSAKGEDEMMEYIASLDMSVFVYDYDYNAPSVEYLKNTHEKMFKKIREKNPDLPMMMKVRSERSLRYCLELIEEQMRVLGLEKDDTYTAQDFTMPYETTEELAKRGIVKVIYGVFQIAFL